MIRHDHGLHLVEEQLRGHATEVVEGLLESGDDDGHRLPRIEAHPQQARVAEDDEQRVPLSPREPKLGEIDLRLVPSRCFEPHHRLRLGARSHLPHEHFELGQAARIARGLALGEESNGGELGIGREPRGDNRLERLEYGRRRGPGPHRRGRAEVPVELTGPEEVVDEPAADAEALRDDGLLETLVQQMSEQHEGIPSVHRRFIRLREKRNIGEGTAPDVPQLGTVGGMTQVCNFNRRFCAISGRR